MAWQPPQVGSRATWTRTFTADDVEAFARLSGDRNPLHFDEQFAAVTAEAEVLEARADKPITRLSCTARREDGTEVLRGTCLVYTMQPEGT